MAEVKEKKSTKAIVMLVVTIALIVFGVIHGFIAMSGEGGSLAPAILGGAAVITLIASLVLQLKKGVAEKTNMIVFVVGLVIALVHILGAMIMG